MCYKIFFKWEQPKAYVIKSSNKWCYIGHVIPNLKIIMQFERILIKLYSVRTSFVLEILHTLCNSAMLFLTPKWLVFIHGVSALIRRKLIYATWCDCNGTRTHLAKLPKSLSCVVSTYLHGAFDCMFLSRHVHVSEWINVSEWTNH